MAKMEARSGDCSERPHTNPTPAGDFAGYFWSKNMTKLTKKQTSLTALAVASVHAIIEAGTSVTSLLRDCHSEADVIFAVSTMLQAVKPALVERGALHMEAEITLKVKNAVTQFIARCRAGQDKVPPKWFNKEKTVSFEPVSFVEYQKRATKKKESDGDADRISKLADERVKALIEDKVELSKAQTAKLAKLEKACQAEKSKAQTLAKQEQGRREKAEAQLAQQGEALKNLQSKHAELQRAYEKAQTQIKALTRALEIAKVDQQAIEALLR